MRRFDKEKNKRVVKEPIPEVKKKKPVTKKKAKK